MMALDPSRIEFLIPLLLVLVQQFAALTRNLTEDLTEVRNNPPLIIPVSPTDGEHSPLKQWLPQLGRLNVLHTTNMGLLTAAFVLVVATEASLVTNILILVVAVVWLQLPLIEGTRYDKIRDENTRPTSLYLHIGGTLLIMAYVAGFSGYDPALFLSESHLLSPEIAYIREQASQVIASGGLLVLIIGTSIGYLSVLDSEL